jgi:hypothetical protein
MKARLGVGTWLAATLLLTYWTQVAVATVHPPFPSVADVSHHAEEADGEAGEHHDPASCALCQVVSQLRDYGPSVPSLRLPLTGEATRLVADLPLDPQPQVSLRGPTSRAPPHSPTV